MAYHISEQDRALSRKLVSFPVQGAAEVATLPLHRQIVIWALAIWEWPDIVKWPTFPEYVGRSRPHYDAHPGECEILVLTAKADVLERQRDAAESLLIEAWDNYMGGITNTSEAVTTQSRVSRAVNAIRRRKK